MNAVAQDLGDTSRAANGDASPRLEARRLCAWCRLDLEATARRDAATCSKRCRQARHRFGRHLAAGELAEAPMRLAYADPPYPGKAGLYVGHPDYAGEVDHRALVSRLQGYDGWALSTSAEALPYVLSLLAGVDVSVGAWFRGSRHARSSRPLSAWEPVVFAGARRVVSSTPGDDALTYVARPRLTEPGRVIGAKPAPFCAWLFNLLGARRGDQLDDLFPGSRGVSRAWRLFSGAAA